MPELTPEERTLRARLAAHTKWARCTDASEATSRARANGPGSIEYWLKKVDPDGELPEKERLRRAQSAKKAFYARIQYQSAHARRKRAGGGKDAA